MKRYPVVIGSTLAGLVGVLSFHSRATTGLLSHSLGVKSGSSAASSPSQGSSSRSGAAGANRSTGQHPSSSGSSSSGSSSSGSSSSGSSSQGSSAPSSATGATEQYGYGALSVQVTVTGSRITDVKVASLQTADSYSQRLAQQIIPYLRREVLHAQTARIQGVSGATYTSEAYAYSLQSALDKLHFH